MTAPSRRLLVGLLVCYTGFLGWVLFNPSAGTASSTVGWVALRLHDLGFSASLVTSSRVEFVLNALMVAPLTALGALIWRRPSWQEWTAYAFLAGLCVELAQGLFLPGRSAQFADVASNTLGAVVGAVAVKVITMTRLRGRRWLSVLAPPTGVRKCDKTHITRQNHP